MLTPVMKKSSHSRKGHTGTAGAGLKSPRRYQLPNRWARIAALPYQPSSVYLAQSTAQGEWLGKSARRSRAWNTAKTPMTTNQTAMRPRFCDIVSAVSADREAGSQPDSLFLIPHV